jgi:hypothetical protein
MHSLHSLSHDMPTASSPHSAIQCFLYQFPVTSHFLKIVRYLLTSSSSCSRHFSPIFLSIQRFRRQLLLGGIFLICRLSFCCSSTVFNDDTSAVFTCLCSHCLRYRYAICMSCRVRFALYRLVIRRESGKQL